MGKQSDKAKQSEKFEPLLARLNELVKEIEHQDVELEQSLKAFEEGIGLVRQAQDYLSGAEQRVSTLAGNPNPSDSGD